MSVNLPLQVNQFIAKDLISAFNDDLPQKDKVEPKFNSEKEVVALVEEVFGIAEVAVEIMPRNENQLLPQSLEDKV